MLLLIMSGDVEENPGPGIEGTCMVMWSMLEPQFSVLCIRTAGFSVQY